MQKYLLSILNQIFNVRLDNKNPDTCNHRCTVYSYGDTVRV